MATKRDQTSKAGIAGNPVLARPESPAEIERRRIAEFAAMGGGQLAYVRKFRASELHHLFPQSSQLHPSVQLFALFGADGTPLMLADSHAAVVSGAWQNNLETILTH